MNVGLDRALLASQNSKLPAIAKDEDLQALREKTDQFEAIIVKMMLDNAMQDEKNIFSESKDPGGKIYKSMFRDELARASAGSFGFSQMLFEHLSERS
ncbi:MAG: rod-binding protein [Campylobacterota bacterium]|nr:rod-binding protein [Campylobacterota bacterium]